MPALLLVARVALSVLLLIAGGSKLADFGTFRHALLGFGVPKSLAGPLGILLPSAEIAIAALLPWTPTAIWGTLAAVVLFAIFSAAIGVNLWRGRNPPCGCFGQVDARPIGRVTLLRAVVLTAIAGLVAWQGPGADIVPVMQGIRSLDVGWLMAVSGGLALLLIQSGLIFMLLRQQGRLLIRVEKLEAGLSSSAGQGAVQTRPSGLPIGSLAPDFHVESLTGRRASLADLTRDMRPVAMLFTDPDCPACTSLTADIADWRRDFGSRLGIAVVSVRDTRGNPDTLTVYGSEDVYFQPGREVADLYRVVGTPTAVLVRGDQTIGSRLAEGADAIRDLMTSFATFVDENERVPQPALLK